MANRDRIDVGEWVDRRFAQLAPAYEWQANTENALVRLHEKGRARKARTIKRTVIAASILFGLAAALPKTRPAAKRLWAGSQIINIGHVSADVKVLKDGQSAPDFALQDATGAILRLSAYKGKVVLLNFWATWCHGCTMEIPWLIQFQTTYKDRGFTVIGVSMDDDGWKAVRPFIANDKMNYPVVIGNQRMAQPYGLDAMPMSFLIDRNGTIAATSVGIIDQAACERQIRQLLQAHN